MGADFFGSKGSQGGFISPDSFLKPLSPLLNQNQQRAGKINFYPMFDRPSSNFSFRIKEKAISFYL